MPVLLEVMFIVVRAIASVEENPVAETPDDKAPIIVGAFTVVEVILKTLVRILAFIEAPVANSTPVRLKLPDDDKLQVTFSSLELVFMVTRVVFAITPNFRIITA